MTVSYWNNRKHPKTACETATAEFGTISVDKKATDAEKNRGVDGTSGRLCVVGDAEWRNEEAAAYLLTLFIAELPDLFDLLNELLFVFG